MKRFFKTIFFHVLIWLTYFILNYLFVKNYKIEFNLSFHIKTWLIQLFLFYVNYSLLIPHILLKNKLVKYLLFSFIVLTSFYAIKFVLNDGHFRNQVIPHKVLRRIPPHDKPPDLDWRGIKPPDFDSDKKVPFRTREIKAPFRSRLKLFPLSGLLLIYLAGISIRLMQKWRNDEKIRTLSEKEKITNELSFLKQQINPHFLFNSLNSIYSLSMTKSEQTTDAILKLSSLLRYILYEGEKQNVALFDEINSITDYIELQKLRVTNKVKINFSVIGQYEHLRIEPLLIIPLVENAFKHGVDNANDSFITIKINIIDSAVEINVSNKKLKGTKQNIENEGGIGLKNIKRRLDLIYPDKHIFHINDEKDLFSVFLKINLR